MGWGRMPGESKNPERNEAQRNVVEGWLVYIVECEGGWLYTGMTGNLLRRWSEHKRGGARFTSGRPPLRVIHVEPFATRSQAEHRERQLKGWTRAKKWALARGDLSLLKRL